MALKVEESPTPSTPSSIFEDEWSENGGTDPFDGLKAVADFNTGLGATDLNDTNSLTLETSSYSADNVDETPYNNESTPSSPSSRYVIEYMQQADPLNIASDHYMPSGIASPIYDGINIYHAPCTQDAIISDLRTHSGFHDLPMSREAVYASSIYPSIETARAAPGHQYPAAFVHGTDHLLQRRSVSEPPGGHLPTSFPHHHHPQAGAMAPAPWNLSRQLAPQPPQLVRLKPQPKTRRPTTNQATPTRRRNIQIHHHPRQATKRARGPTSMPSSPIQNPAGMDEIPIGHPIESPRPHMSPLEFVSTRVCTPTPSPKRMRTPTVAGRDAPPWATSHRVGIERSKGEIVSIPVSVEELQMLIEGAVRKAVRELKEDGGVGGQ